MGPYALTTVSFETSSPTLAEVRDAVAAKTGLDVEVVESDGATASALGLTGDALQATVPVRCEAHRVVVDANDIHPYAAAAVLRVLVELGGTCADRRAHRPLTRWADTPRRSFAVRRGVRRVLANPLLLPFWLVTELLMLPVLALLALLTRRRPDGARR